MSMQMFRIAPKMPEMNSRDCFWAHIGDLTTQKIFFDLLDRNTRAMIAVNFHFCNSTYELESEAFTMFPELLPIGPLLASNRLGSSAGYFWREDSNCLKWLDQQQPSSVIYAAFGSLTRMQILHIISGSNKSILQGRTSFNATPFPAGRQTKLD